MWKIFVSCYILFGSLIPHSQEYVLEITNHVSFNAHVHVAPITYLFRTVYVVIGNVHTACVSNLSVYYNNFPVIAMQSIVNPRKTHGIVFVNFQTFRTEFAEFVFFYGFVVRSIAECVIKHTHLHALGCLFFQKFKQCAGNGIVAKIKILEMHGMASLGNGGKHVLELFFSRCQENKTVVARNIYVFAFKVTRHYRIGTLCDLRISTHRNKNKYYNG